MKTSPLISTIVATALVIGCSAGPSVLKGSVVMRTTGEAHIDLGSEDGLQRGDSLTVWREERGSSLSTRTVRVGMVRVTRILDASHAAVEILTGHPQEGDRVEKTLYLRK